MVRLLLQFTREHALFTAPRFDTPLFVLAPLTGLAWRRTGSAASAMQSAFAEALEAGGCDGVADPFSNLYLAQIAPMMAYGGR